MIGCIKKDTSSDVTILTSEFSRLARRGKSFARRMDGMGRFPDSVKRKLVIRFLNARNVDRPVDFSMSMNFGFALFCKRDARFPFKYT